MGIILVKSLSCLVPSFLFISSTSLSWSTSTGVAVWQDFSLLFFLGFFYVVVTAAPSIFTTSFSSGSVVVIVSGGVESVGIAFVFFQRETTSFLLRRIGGCTILFQVQPCYYNACLANNLMRS